jgi:hypothetical protein
MEPLPEKFSGTWPAWGLLRRGVFFRLPPSEALRSGSDCSSWPTIRSEEAGEYQNQRDGTTQPTLTGVAQQTVSQWPTPNAQVSNDGETPETWQARADKIKEQGINGNGAGTPLAIAAQQWNSPAAGGGVSVSRGGDRIDEPLLAKQAEMTAQWATPQAHDSQGGSPDRIKRHGTKHGDRNLADDVTMWATPSAASDANGCSSPEKTAERHAKMPGHKPSILREQVELSPIGPQAQPTEPNGSESSPQGPTSRLRLNPEFVRWLMGFPPGWVNLHPLALTSFERWVMASCRLLARLRS